MVFVGPFYSVLYEVEFYKPISKRLHWLIHNAADKFASYEIVWGFFYKFA